MDKVFIDECDYTTDRPFCVLHTTYDVKNSSADAKEK